MHVFNMQSFCIFTENSASSLKDMRSAESENKNVYEETDLKPPSLVNTSTAAEIQPNQPRVCFNKETKSDETVPLFRFVEINSYYIVIL